MKNFWDKVEKTDGCWNWKASTNSRGYGQLKMPNTRKNVLAHRLSYTMAFGDIKDGLFVCHKCDNRTCVNPNHLFVGTAKENMQDMDAKGRRVKANMAGVKNPNATLDEDKVKLLKLLKDKFPMESLIKIFGVKKTQIHRIINGQQWSHI